MCFVIMSFETVFPFPTSTVVLKFGLLDLLEYSVASLESFNLRKGALSVWLKEALKKELVKFRKIS